MIIWLASYPRSGNTLFRILLHRLFGFQTYSVYSAASAAERMPDDNDRMMRLVGQSELETDVGLLHSSSGVHFVKTHDLPGDDGSPAVVLVRDGRAAVVSYAYFLLKTERGIEEPERDLFETTLEQVIMGDAYGGWSRNVKAWIDRVGQPNIVRYEDLIADPVNIAAAALRRLGFREEAKDTVPPSFQELHASIRWFFRRGKPESWRDDMPSHLEELFVERHGETLVQLGYSLRTSSSVPGVK